jgi:hypothetical protein
MFGKRGTSITNGRKRKTRKQITEEHKSWGAWERWLESIYPCIAKIS